ncbi:MAG: transcriptional repressor [Candidatus Carbobacillus altaicus]|uniref:Peroxide stress regulator PerR, FUR family n=1 Tax=Candidatus Carbonibacillus altaicus TaxID=2163959 RepID=A0A2R6XZR3_9BACL|nr:transcriptional repressor [Candidatus Carbobacillus altaicus]PTQ55916.1 MAG: Peroxide stress regulator PerR, FUR family [Candidatus Carbobacillus altaicus]
MTDLTLEERLEEAVKTLKVRGVRMTPQRYAILSYLLETRSHPTADEIYKALADRFPSMSVATVYNNLKLLKEAGLVRELTFGDQASRFDGQMHDHYHVTCIVCGRIDDFEYPPMRFIEKEAERLTGYATAEHRMEVYGICPACRKAQEEAKQMAMVTAKAAGNEH